MNAVLASGISSMSLSLIAAQPRMLDPSMPNPSCEGIFRQLGDRIGNVMLQAGDVGESQIELLRFVLLGKIQDFLGLQFNLLWVPRK